METASDLVWKYLEDTGQMTRAQASEIFASIIFTVADLHDCSNGLTVGALAAGLDALCPGPQQLQKVRDYIAEAMDEEEDN
jgi:hypothetical protein